MSIFTIVYCSYIIFIRYASKKKMIYYRKIGYEYEVDLDSKRVFLTVFIGGFMGGVMQGILGVGTGHCMVGSLIYVGLNQKIASATSSFQIFFIGIATTIQAIA